MIWKASLVLSLALCVLSDRRPAISEQRVERYYSGHHGELSHIGHHEPEHREVYAWAYPSYEFSYHVDDPHTHDVKGQHEIRDGDKVTGNYWLIQPDGRKRIVKYRSDHKSGFQAEVNYMPRHGVHDERNHIEVVEWKDGSDERRGSERRGKDQGRGDERDGRDEQRGRDDGNRWEERHGRNEGRDDRDGRRGRDAGREDRGHDQGRDERKGNEDRRGGERRDRDEERRDGGRRDERRDRGENRDGDHRGGDDRRSVERNQRQGSHGWGENRNHDSRREGRGRDGNWVWRQIHGNEHFWRGRYSSRDERGQDSRRENDERRGDEDRRRENDERRGDEDRRRGNDERREGEGERREGDRRGQPSYHAPIMNFKPLVPYGQRLH